MKKNKIFILILMISSCCNWSETCEKNESKPIEINEAIKLDSKKQFNKKIKRWKKTKLYQKLFLKQKEK